MDPTIEKDVLLPVFEISLAWAIEYESYPPNERITFKQWDLFSMDHLDEILPSNSMYYSQTVWSAHHGSFSMDAIIQKSVFLTNIEIC